MGTAVNNATDCKQQASLGASLGGTIWRAGDTPPRHRQATMKFKTTITGRSLAESVEAVVTAADQFEARIKALRRWSKNRKVCAFRPYNALVGQDPSGQAGYGYERAAASSGCDYAAATGLIRVYMEPC